MLRWLDRLGGGLLGLLRLVFLSRAARKTLGAGRTGAPQAGTPGPAPQPGADGEDGDREQLIARAVSLHREKQGVLAKLDDRSRRKLTAMAQRMMAAPKGGRKRR